MINPALALIAVSGADAAAQAAASGRFGSPKQIAARIVGLGEAELAAGVPKWAWAASGFVLGAAVMFVAAPHLRSALSKARD